MNEKKVSDLLQSDKESWFQDKIVSNAPSIIGIFANFVVIFADIRAYDVVYRLTDSWWKALSASLACAIPFILWEIGWQYNHTTETWRGWSLAMAGLAFGTSVFLGVADYLNFTGEWTGVLMGGVVILTGVHTVMGFLYYYNDPDVARRRYKSQALATMLDQETNAQVAESLLKNGQALLNIIKGLENNYDPDDVAAVMNILQGKKKSQPSSGTKRQQFQPRRAGAMASDAEQMKLVNKPDPTKAGQ
jgi:hypothetical protein